MLRGNAASLVPQAERDGSEARVVAGGQLNAAPAVRQCLAGVENQVDQYLFDALGIAAYVGEMFAVLAAETAGRLTDGRLNQTHGRLGHAVQVDDLVAGG